MKRLLPVLLTLAVLLGSAGEGWSADYQKGLDAYNKKDYATALREWKHLAEQGDVDAQYSLGLMYEEGQGVPQDYKTAVKWIRFAAEQGVADAQGNLGAMYAFGKGVLKDYVYAHMWGNIAAMNGNKLGAKLRDHFEKKMTPADISAAQNLARECVRKKYKGC
jgi:TPR repeat protein